MGGIEYEFRKCRNSLGINAATEFGDHSKLPLLGAANAIQRKDFAIARPEIDRSSGIDGG